MLIIYMIEWKSRADYLNNYNNKYQFSVSIKNVISEYNGRQGLTIDCLSNVNIENSSFSNTGQGRVYSPPGAGIDIECHSCHGLSRNIRIKNCVFHNNRGSGIVNDSFHGKCPEIDKNKKKHYFPGIMNLAENLEINDCVFSGAGRFLLYPESPGVTVRRSLFITERTSKINQIPIVRSWITGNCSKYSGIYGCTQYDDSFKIIESIIYHRNDKVSYTMDQVGGTIEDSVIISDGNPIIWSNGPIVFKNTNVLYRNKCHRKITFAHRGSGFMTFKNVNGYYTGPRESGCIFASGKYKFNCFRACFLSNKFSSGCDGHVDLFEKTTELKVIKNARKVLKSLSKIAIDKAGIYETIRIINAWPSNLRTVLKNSIDFRGGKIKFNPPSTKIGIKSRIIYSVKGKNVREFVILSPVGIFTQGNELHTVSYVKPITGSLPFSVYTVHNIFSGKKLKEKTGFIEGKLLFIRAEKDDTNSVYFVMISADKYYRVTVSK
ncbi:hypothetical protein KKF34_09305 [Myxococcota bacterium]|nr:hypothetical protein [Myxococcota bacterium]MBU1379336.1 hypothetical protein [Myxococcota bacterium]MBU1497060.1 hypothetical protein [Myxococcota bacterium]